MTSKPSITEVMIRSMATSQSFQRGQDYYRAGAGSDLTRRGNTLTAEVEGSDYEPYQVTIHLAEENVSDGACTCPYDWGGVCKHIVAVLLTYVHRQDEIPERPTVDSLLADLDRDILLDLLQAVLERQPGLVDWLEAQLAVRSQAASSGPAAQATPPHRRMPIDTSAIRRLVRYQMQAYDHHDYYATSGVVSSLDDVAEQARQFLAAGDGENVLRVLATIVEEYLNLAEAEGQTTRYLVMLVKAGRAEDAARYPYLATTSESLSLAQALRDHGHPEAALQEAERGLNLAGEKRTLSSWLRDFAAGQGDTSLALRAARIALQESYNLEDYLAVQAQAADDWPTVKQELLDYLADKKHGYGRIDIYLHEGLVDQALKAIDADPYAGYSTVERVVDAALELYPDWAIKQCKRQAEPIMDSGKSKYYHHAARWLEKAKRAYLAAGREREWRTYLTSLLDKHNRKYSLMPRLRQLQ